uniref:Apolipoprotein D n=1 Tax=Tetranychus evansi TaxID=178897 RepID=A0A3G5APA9_9ACAR|nr:apolipo D [Tetranychus evansi]
MNSTFNVFIFFLAIGVTFVYGQRPSPGGCPKITSNALNNTAKFDINKYTGLWYEIERTFNVFEIGLRCVTAEYLAKPDGTIGVVNHGLSKWGQKVNVEGSGRVADRSRPSYLKVAFKYSPEAPYWIADTDYNNYAVVVSCSDVLGVFRVDSIWILSRTRDLPQSTLDALHSYIDQLGLRSSALSRVDQTNCPK